MSGTIPIGAPNTLRGALIVAAAVIVVCGTFPAGAIAQGSPAMDRAALEVLYDATDGPNWTDNTNWKTDAPLAEWYGVTTDADGRVVGLELNENGLVGELPEELGGLDYLRWLWLYVNDLSGTIPAQLGRLSRLGALALSRNALTGPIPPELGGLANLEYLQLGSNDLNGQIPPELGNLARLRWLYLWYNSLTGPVPRELGNLVNLERMYLSANELTGPIPPELGSLASELDQLGLDSNWGLSGFLPQNLRRSQLGKLNIFFTQTCAPAGWRDWLTTIEFDGRLCGAEGVTIDVAVVYTPAAREAAGGTAAIEALIDLWVADTNGAYDASGVRHRLALAAREEVDYVESGDAGIDMERLSEPSDGYLDSVHDLRDRAGADLVHLIVSESNFGGQGQRPGAFSFCIVTFPDSSCFAHELGHNMALRHDRYERSIERDWGGGVLTSDPAYGYVNQRAFGVDAPESSRWRTIMAYETQCDDADFRCNRLLRFSNPQQQYDGDPLGVPQEPANRGVDGPADAVAVLNATGPAVALWRDPPAAVNRPPEPVGALPPLRIGLNDGSATVDVSGAFRDPDGDPLTYGATTSAAQVAAVSVSGSRVTVTPVSDGAATVRVRATDPGGLSAAQTFTVTVGSRATRSFTDHPLVGGVTPIKAVHFRELRERIDALRTAAGLARFGWTDPVITAGVTPVKLVHLLELRSALGAAYAAAGRSAPRWTETAPTGGTTPIRAAHLMELRAAVIALE